MARAQHYTFGDSELAAERLRLLAQVFAPSSGRLLQALADPGGELAIDLGCGAGYTTELLAEYVRARQVIGLDQSPRLLEQAARERHGERLSFVLCDVSSPPFPVAAADVLYSRFLLTHLRDPAQIVRSWASAARPGARLVLEETAFMTGQHPAFPRYYALVERMQAHYGQRMYAGRELQALAVGPDWVVESGQIAVLALPAPDMARLHELNLRTWSEDAFARENYGLAQLSGLGQELAAIADGSIDLEPVSVGMGQLILRRR